MAIPGDVASLQTASIGWERDAEALQGTEGADRVLERNFERYMEIAERAKNEKVVAEAQRLADAALRRLALSFTGHVATLLSGRVHNGRKQCRARRPRLRRSSLRPLPVQSFQMLGKVLVHLEHGHLVLAENLLELVVSQDFAAVLWIL